MQQHSKSDSYNNFSVGLKDRANDFDMEEEDLGEIPQEDIITESTLTETNNNNNTTTNNNIMPPDKSDCNPVISVTSVTNEELQELQKLQSYKEMYKGEKSRFFELYKERIRGDLKIRKDSIYLVELFLEHDIMRRSEAIEQLIKKGLTEKTAKILPSVLKKEKILAEENGLYFLNADVLRLLIKGYEDDISPQSEKGKHPITNDVLKEKIKPMLNNTIGELLIDFSKIDEETKNRFLNRPEETISIAISEDPRTDKSEPLKIVFENIPTPRKLYSQDISAKYIGKLIEIKGTVFATTACKPRIIDAVYSCEQCGEYNSKPNDNLWEEPKRPTTCDNRACGRNGPFKLVKAFSIFTDIKIATIRSVGDNSKGLLVIFRDEDARIVERGMTLKIQGILKTREIKTQKAENSFYYVEAINFEKIEKNAGAYDKTSVKDFIAESVKEYGSFSSMFKVKAFPRIAGMETVKEAILLSLISPHWKDRGFGKEGYERDNLHVLLVSDYGQAKGMFQRYIKDIEDIGEISGGHCTQAGLISTTISDPETGIYLTVPGTLAKSDEKHVVINELQNVPLPLMANLREAFEDGITHVDKANSSEKIISRVTCIAFANYDTGNINEDYIDKPRSQITWADKGFLSRMDIVLFAYDDIEDDTLTKKIIEAKRNPETDIETIKKIRETISYMRDIYPNTTDDIIDELAKATNELLKKYKESKSKESRGRISRTIECLARAYARLDDSDTITTEHISKAKEMLINTFSCMDVLGQENYSQKEKMQDVKAAIQTLQEKGKVFENDILEYLTDEKNRSMTQEQLGAILHELKNKGEIYYREGTGYHNV